MDDQHLELVREVHRREWERRRAAGELPVPEEATIPCAELPSLPPDSPYHSAWNTYRRSIESLIQDGLAGFWLAIKDDAIIGIYPGPRFACAAFASESRDYQKAILIKQIRKCEPKSSVEQLSKPWPNSPVAGTA